MLPVTNPAVQDPPAVIEGSARFGALPKSWLNRILLVLAGIALGQALIYTPSLIGERILLPLDVLAQPRSWIPRDNEADRIQPWDLTLSDQVYLFEPMRRYAARELRAGRLPLWSPDYFTGAPCVWSICSPFALFDCLSESPVILAWKALLTSVIAGLGMYRFCRRALCVGFWPACICAWCYPLTGFFVLWLGFYQPQTVCLFPWLLLAVNATIRRRGRLAPIGLSVVTGLAAWGQLDIAGQMLLVSGVYALWCFWHEYRRSHFSVLAKRAMLLLTLGWSLGLMLATPQILPYLEYLSSGSRPAKRSQGMEERPPAGLKALPQTMFPDFYGRSTRDTLLISTYAGNLQESGASAYAGALLMLFVAPLAFCDKRRLSVSLLLGGLGLLGVGWVLKLPLFVQVLRLPLLNMMSHNRLTFATAFAFVALAAVGLDALNRGYVRWNWWAWIPLVALTTFGSLSVRRAVILPEPVRSEIPDLVSAGLKFGWVQDSTDVRKVQQWFLCHSLAAGLICASGIGLWLLVKFRASQVPRILPFIAASLVAELLWNAQRRQPQADPALYYPRIPVLEQIAKSTPGRVIGYDCLPANLASMAGLRDVRGYNGVDPAPITELLTKAADPRSESLPYARTQWMIPKMKYLGNGLVQFPPILDLLGVRYVIYRGSPPPGLPTAFSSPDYWVWENTNALPRVIVPKKVQLLKDREIRLAEMASSDFDPRQTAFVENPVTLPHECSGRAEISTEELLRIQIRAQMGSAGLVVLTDSWDKGWRASLDGKPVPILRTDHALRGVVVPTGEHALEFRYQPTTLVWGFRFAALALVTLAVWALACWRQDMKRANLRSLEGSHMQSQ